LWSRLGAPWRLDIRSDGSARLRYQRGKTEQNAEARSGTFDFPALVARLSTLASDEGHCERNVMVFFHWEGQRGGVLGKNLHDEGLVKSLFQQTLGRCPWRNRALKLLWTVEWLDLRFKNGATRDMTRGDATAT
jgi:hypothetical protein